MIKHFVTVKALTEAPKDKEPVSVCGEPWSPSISKDKDDCPICLILINNSID